MTRPVLILDPHFRRVGELFSPEVFKSLEGLCSIVGADGQPMAPGTLVRHLPVASFLIAARPALKAPEIATATNLKAIIEVAGAFHNELDYQACWARSIEVLSSAPGFQYSVAEMALAMILSGARGLIQEHEAFRRGEERWLEENPNSDFTIYRQSVGFVGYGQIARECHRLLAPFAPTVRAFDPWLDGDAPENQEVIFAELDDVLRASRVLVIAAAPTAQNWRLIDSSKIELLPEGALVVLISRAHLTDLPELIEAARRGRIRLATDVFDREPVSPTDPIRQAPNTILSPHRAAAVQGGRRAIGEMILHDVKAILDGRPERRLKTADEAHLNDLVRGQEMIATASAFESENRVQPTINENDCKLLRRRAGGTG